MKNKKKAVIITLMILLFISPLVLFWLIYPFIMDFSNQNILFPVYKSLMSKGCSVTFAMNIRILLKGFVFSVVLMVLWFPLTLGARVLYLRKYYPYIQKHPY